MNEPWYSNTARFLTIGAAVCLYLIALASVLRRKKRPAAADVSSPARNALFEYSGPEKRLYPRVPLEIVVRYKPCGEKGKIQVFREGRVTNLSESGMLLEAGEIFSVNDTLEFKLRLPGTAPFMLMRGRVVWVKEMQAGMRYEYGISITNIDSDCRKQIAKYVTEQQFLSESK